MILSGPAKNLLENYQARAASEIPQKDGGVIHVDEIAAKFALFYEKVRSAVDYHDEHLLRKIFILRAMRRRLFISTHGNIAEPLIKELIRAGYLPNDQVLTLKIAEVKKIIDNYYELLREIKSGKIPKGGALSEWILDISVSSIEECLFPQDLSDAFASDLLFETIENNLNVVGAHISDSEKKVQLFIAIQRAFLKADSGQLQYRLLKILYPDWNKLEGKAREDFLLELPRIKNDFEKLPKNPLAPFFLQFANHYNIVYWTIRDIINETKSYEDLAQILIYEEELENTIRAVYAKRIKKELSRIRRIALLSVISFFFSKIAIALLIEIPVEMKITHGFSIPMTIFSMLFPPMLMFFIVIMVKLPSRANLKLITREIKEILYDVSKKQYIVQIPAKHSPFMEFSINLFYVLVSIGIFYLAFDQLRAYDFGVANSVIFLVFTSLVVATGVKINNRTRNLSLEKEKAGVFSFIFDLLTIPFVTLGQWIIGGVMRFNVLMIAVNFLIELPFQVFIEFLENFRRFLSIKKEEID